MRTGDKPESSCDVVMVNLGLGSVEAAEDDWRRRGGRRFELLVPRHDEAPGVPDADEIQAKQRSAGAAVARYLDILYDESLFNNY